MKSLIFAAVMAISFMFANFCGAVDLAMLNAKYSNTLVDVVFMLKYDERGEAPSAIGVYCAACAAFHDNDPERLLADKQDLQISGFAVSKTQIIAPALLIDPEGVEKIVVRSNGFESPARITAIYPQQGAIQLDLQQEIPSIQPLQFVSANNSKKFFAYSRIMEFGRWVSRCISFSPQASISLFDSKRFSFAVPGNSLIVDGNGNAVALLANNNETLSKDEWKLPIAQWQRISISQFETARTRLQEHLRKNVLPVTVYFQERKLSRREKLMNIVPQLELCSYVFMLPDGKLFMPLLTTPQQNSLIKKVVVSLPEKDIQLPIAGVMKNFGGIILTLADNSAIPLKPIAPACVSMLDGFGSIGWSAGIGIFMNRLHINVYSDILGAVFKSYHDISGGAALKKAVPELLFTLDGRLLGVNIGIRAFNHRSMTPILDAADLERLLNDPREMLPLKAMSNPIDAVGFLGVEYQAITPHLAQQRSIEHLTNGGRNGLMITYVYPGSPADKLGLRPGDCLLKIILPDGGPPIQLNAQNFGHPQERQFPWQNLDEIPDMYFSEIPEPWKGVKNPLTLQLTNIGIGKETALVVISGNKLVTRNYKISASPTYFEIAPSYRSSSLGLEVRDMTFEVRRYFRNDKAARAPGVIISDVIAGRVAAVAGLRPFEIVTAVDDQPVHSVEDFRKAVAGKSEVRLSVRRLAADRVVTIRPAVGPRQ